MGRIALVCLGLGVCLASGCRAPPGQVAAAGITTGSALALAAANRAVTNDCWASCDHGYVCDRENGVCVLPSELKVPQRPMADPDDWDDGCIEEDDGTRLCPEEAVPTDGGTDLPDGTDGLQEPPPAEVDRSACDGGADCPDPSAETR